MATVVTCGLLLMVIYAAAVYLLYPYETPTHGGRQNTAEHEPSASISDNDIMGKSTFDVNVELRRIRQAKEEAARKEAVAKGEMTEDGKEIAQEIWPEDCETEAKKVIVQVPDDELDDMFTEQDVPRAKGDIINDLDLKFGAGRHELDEEEERRVSENMYRTLDDTIFLDDICSQAPEVGREIRRMIDKYKKEMSNTIGRAKKCDEEIVLQRKFTMAERYADIDFADLV